MVPRAARRSFSPRPRFSRRGVQVALPLLLTLAGAITFSSSPAAAATNPGTDTIDVFNGPTTLSESLPPGTPEVVTPIATVIDGVCTPISNNGGINVGAVEVCDTYFFGPVSGTVVVAAIQPSIGVLLPEGYTCTPPTSGIAVQVGSAGVYLEPPGTGC